MNGIFDCYGKKRFLIIFGHHRKGKRLARTIDKSFPPKTENHANQPTPVSGQQYRGSLSGAGN